MQKFVNGNVMGLFYEFAVKIPQILKIFGGKSAAGITFISVVLELFAITSNLSYSFVSGYPFR